MQRAVKKYSRTLKGRYSNLKKRSKLKNITLDLTFEEYWAILAKSKLKCHYCGSKLNDTGYGLDRKDSNKGYTKDNVVTCCGMCNRTKNCYLSYEEMIWLSKRRARRQQNKGANNANERTTNKLKGAKKSVRDRR